MKFIFIKNFNCLQLLKYIHYIIITGYFIFIGGSSCNSPKSSQETLFTLLPSSHTGIDFRNDLKSTDSLDILEYLYFYNGGGVALGDINKDGLVDIYFTSNQGENKLYLNKGNFEFEDITTQANVTGDGGWSTGVTMADVNGDGLLDIYVCQVGDYKGLKGKNKLYINNGDLTFSEQAEAYGIDFSGFSTHAVFFDYDQDGDLDLYLLNHSIKKPEVFSQADTKFGSQDGKGGDRLFKSLLSEGENRMQDVTEEAGILSSSLGFGLGVGIADVNGDGWLDLYVSNDFTEDDYLYINQQDGTFIESLADFIDHTSRYSMGNDLADINNDGLVDIFTTDMLPEDPEIWMKSVGEDKQEVFDVKKRLGYKDQFVRNHLQLNRGDGRFSEIALLTGTFATDWSWSPLLFDMDNDGLVDIHVTNGIVKRPNDLDFIQYSQEPAPSLSPTQIQQQQIDMLPSVKLSNYTFQNTGNLKFENVGKSWGLDQISYSNGSAYADLDNDGDLDLVINNTNQEAFIYQNNSSKNSDNRFFQIALEGEAFNHFGIGSQVWVYANGKIHYQVLSTSRGFQSGPSTLLTFGLGKSTVDSVVVAWSANNLRKYIVPDTLNRVTLAIHEGEIHRQSKAESENILELATIDLDWEHQENDFDEFRREYLMPRRYAEEGPALAVGDINGDGLEDLYLGGAKGQAGALFLQTTQGAFEKVDNPIFDQLKTAEDVVAKFADFNGNGYLDLYVGSGGNEYTSSEMFNFDRVYLNDGKGNLIFSMNSLPPFGENTSALAIHDVNGDGYPDIFVGASVVTGNYGASPRSYLLLNDGKGRFRDVTEHYFGVDFRPGMIQDALWTDWTGDGKSELVLVGEWMPIKVFQQNQTGTFEVLQDEKFEQPGWYYAIASDGQNTRQLLLGNLGLNSKLKAQADNPVKLLHGDFDNNGQEDPLIFHYQNGKLVPFASRDDLIRQLPGLKRKHNSYVSYAQIKQPEDLLDKEQIKSAEQRDASEFRSGWISNYNNSASFATFPIEAQFSPIRSFANFESQGKRYVLGVGNMGGFRNDFGRAYAQPMVLMEWDTDRYIHRALHIDGNAYWGEFRQVKKIEIGGVPHLIALRNNQSPVILKIKSR